MPIALRSNSCPEFFTRHGRCTIAGSYKTSLAFDDTLYETGSNGRDSRYLSTACRSGEAKGKLDEGLVEGSASGLQEECEGYFCQKVNDERQQADDLEAVASPASTSTWTLATITAETSPASSPRLHPKDNHQVQCNHGPQSPPAFTNQHPLPEESFLLELERSLASYQQPPEKAAPAPYLSCTLARRNAYLYQSHLRSERAYYAISPPNPANITPPLKRHDAIYYQPSGHFTVIRYGKLKPNRFRDWFDRVFVHKVAVKVGWREEGGWDAVVRGMAERMRKARKVECRGPRPSACPWHLVQRWDEFMGGEGRGIADMIRNGRRIDCGF